MSFQSWPFRGGAEDATDVRPVAFEELEPRVLLDAAWTDDDAAGVVDVPAVVASMMPSVADSGKQLAAKAPGQMTNIDVNTFLPLIEGNQWNYAGSTTVATSFLRQVDVLAPLSTGMVTASRVQVIETDPFGSELVVYYITQTAGVQLHQVDDFGTITNPAAINQDFYSPLMLLPATVDVGDIIAFSDTFTILEAAIPGVGTVAGSFTINGWEQITVPAGAFDVLKVTRSEVTNRNTGLGNRIITRDDVFYLAENIGIIRHEFTVSDTSPTLGSSFISGSVDLTSYVQTGFEMSVGDYVDSLYEGILRRAADAAGRAAFVQQIQFGGISRAFVAQGFVTSNEFNSVIAPIQRLYNGFLGRYAETTGLDVWVAQLRAGVSLGQIAAAIAASPEFIARNGTVFTTANDADFVRFLYVNVLGRIPSESAANNEVWTYVQQLQSGITRGGVMAQFTESAEFANPRFAAVQAVALFQGLLNRLPSTSERNTFAAQILASAQAAAAQTILDSAEYGSQCTFGEFCDAAPIVRLYEGILNRHADFAGLSAWFTAFQGGLPLSTIAQAFVQSAEITGTFGDLFGAASNSAYIDFLYTRVLKRTPSLAERTTFVTLLGTGAITRVDLILVFTESGEFLSTVSQTVVVQLVYAEFFDRAPSPGELASGVAFLGAGNSVGDLLVLLL